jgi:hypothetical protein
MKRLFELEFEECCNPPAVSSGGDKLLVPFGDALHLFTVKEDGSLTEERIISLPLNLEDEEHSYLPLRYPRVVSVDDDRAVVVGETAYTHWIAADIDLKTGSVRATYLDDSTFPVFGQNPILLDDSHVLVATLETAVCLNLGSFQEVFRIRTYDEEYCAVGEEDVTPDEQITQGGVVWDASRAMLHVAWRAFNENSLQGYDIDLNNGTCARAYRSSAICEDDGAGLSLDPGGNGFCMMIQTMDKVILYPPGQTEPPRLAPLGCLVWTNLEGVERDRLPVDGELGRDFAWSSHQQYGADGIAVAATGYRFSAEDKASPPIYIRPDRIILGTPGGLLIEANRAARTQEIIHDLGECLNGLQYHSSTNRLFAACGNRLIVLES